VDDPPLGRLFQATNRGAETVREDPKGLPVYVGGMVTAGSIRRCRLRSCGVTLHSDRSRWGEAEPDPVSQWLDDGLFPGRTGWRQSPEDKRESCGKIQRPVRADHPSGVGHFPTREAPAEVAARWSSTSFQDLDEWRDQFRRLPFPVCTGSQDMPEIDVRSDDLTQRFLTVNDVRLHYAESGHGEPALLIPGWPQTLYAWRHVAPLLAAEGRRVIVLDPRGVGGSDKPVHGYDLDTVASDVHGFVTQLGLVRAGGIDVVSHDVGSWISYALASAYPDDVRRLVLSEMTIQTSDTMRPIPDDSTNIASWHFGFNRLPDLPETLVAGRERLFLDWLFDHKAKRPEAIDAVAREHYARSFAAPGAARAGFDYYRALLSTSGLRRMTERVAQPLAMPVLAIGADGGVGTGLADSLHGAALALHSVVLAGGHYLPEEAPAEFTQAVLSFWQGAAR
jgi:pimeloyl-ACP methyl ester carboxylesterase